MPSIVTRSAIYINVWVWKCNSRLHAARPRISCNTPSKSLTAHNSPSGCESILSIFWHWSRLFRLRYRHSPYLRTKRECLSSICSPVYFLEIQYAVLGRDNTPCTSRTCPRLDYTGFLHFPLSLPEPWFKHPSLMITSHTSHAYKFHMSCDVSSLSRVISEMRAPWMVLATRSLVNTRTCHMASKGRKQRGSIGVAPTAVKETPEKEVIPGKITESQWWVKYLGKST